MDSKCTYCGDTIWLLEKDENRSYYARVEPGELKWIEQTKKKRVSGFRLICSKCGGSADTRADKSYVIKEKPLKVVWQTKFWENLKKE